MLEEQNSIQKRKKINIERALPLILMQKIKIAFGIVGLTLIVNCVNWTSSK